MMLIPTFVTLNDFLTWAYDYFEEQDLYYGHGTDNSWDEAVMLAMYVLSLPVDNDVSILEQKLTIAQQQKLYEIAQKRATTRLPLPYITNEAWFAGERYYVNENVLIPRSPFAELIANHFHPWLGDKEPLNILDMCTGSACLAIYCAKEFPNATIDAVDISKKALDVAHKNITLHNCVERVHAIESDLFTNIQGKRYDIIISNPPYVGKLEMESLPLEYTHEPVLALESGEDGLDLTIQILQQAANYLTPDGLLIIEVGNSWEALQERFPKAPFIWLELENGGDGVFLLTYDELQNLKI